MAEAAEVFARLVAIQTKAGLVMLLAMEISASRILPQYCYFPFDPTDQKHRAYLSDIVSHGEIRLSFYTGRRFFFRSHTLDSFLRKRASEIYMHAVNTVSETRFECNFELSLQEIERWVRIPHLLAHILSGTDLTEIAERVEEAAHNVPDGKKTVGRRLAQDAVEKLAPYYERHRAALFDKLALLRSGLLYLEDIERTFTHDSVRLTQLFGNALASTFSDSDLEKANTGLKFLSALLPAMKSSGEPAAPTGGISQDSLNRFLELLGIKIGGTAGRPVKDYSKAYDLKASGFSWRKVSRQIFDDDSELRTEFGVDVHEKLSFEQKQKLSNRIREGVRSYAKRAGLVFPPKR